MAETEAMVPMVATEAMEATRLPCKSVSRFDQVAIRSFK
jgi:hypothetical protein